MAGTTRYKTLMEQDVRAYVVQFSTPFGPFQAYVDDVLTDEESGDVSGLIDGIVAVSIPAGTDYVMLASELFLRLSYLDMAEEQSNAHVEYTTAMKRFMPKPDEPKGWE